ncbi:MAG: hypothetical protein SFV24_16800 [Gemmatimonadales bacterium]|nr:hypothetical protein [Gemmatimonadales bacterium]
MDAVERRAALQGRWRAQARELESWSSLVAGWIESFGTPAVREKLISEVGRARFGFQPFALHLLNRGLLAPIDLASAYADLRPLEDMPSVVRGPLMIGKPELPPLGIKQGSVKKRRGKKP